ncbi:hypothetical protein V8E53_007633 [Lactarius tabidus]
MATRLQFENSSDISVFSKLTNTYYLVAIQGSTNFYSVFEAELSKVIPIVHTSIGSTHIIGRLTAGNCHSLIVPSTMTDQELQHICNTLPDTVSLQRVKERLSVLGSVIVCNDHVVPIHPDVDHETEEIITDVCKVEVFCQTIADNVLDQGELSSLLQIPLVVCPILSSSVIALLMFATRLAPSVEVLTFLVPGLVVNDWCAFTGLVMMAMAIGVMEATFSVHPLFFSLWSHFHILVNFCPAELQGENVGAIVGKMHNALMDNWA